jgi:hypothetical protein
VSFGVFQVLSLGAPVEVAWAVIGGDAVAMQGARPSRWRCLLEGAADEVGNLLLVPVVERGTDIPATVMKS